MMAFLEAYRAGLFARNQWAPNLRAGVVVGVVALPLAMAFAIASGVRPEQGLYTAIIGGVVVALFGGSRVQIAGPTGAFIVILSSITAQYGISGLQLATLMAGCILVLMGLTRMGNVIKFIPTPVILGFTAGIGVIIFVGQWSYFLGLPGISGTTPFPHKVWQLLHALPHVHLPTLALATLSLALVIGTPHLKQPGFLARIPSPLIAMMLVTALQSLMQWPGIATIGSAFGGIPSSLPSWSPPHFSLSQMIALVGPAFTIAMLGSIESLLSAVVADGMSGTRHQSNQELIGQGLANIITPLLGGFAVTGGVARTTTSIRHGATSPLAGLTHSLTLVAILLFLAPMASHIPLACLAGILFVVAWNMSNTPNVTRVLQKAPTADRVILVLTFFLTLFAGLVVAVNVGVILATLHFLRRMAETFEICPTETATLQDNLDAHGLQALPPDVRVYEIHGPVFFGAAESFEQALLRTETTPKTLIVRLRFVPFIDITGIHALEKVVHQLHTRGVHVLLCEANSRVYGKLHKADLLHTPEDNQHETDYVPTLSQALERVLPARTPSKLVG